MEANIKRWATKNGEDLPSEKSFGSENEYSKPDGQQSGGVEESGQTDLQKALVQNYEANAENNKANAEKQLDDAQYFKKLQDEADATRLKPEVAEYQNKKADKEKKENEVNKEFQQYYNQEQGQEGGYEDNDEMDGKNKQW